MKVKRLGPARSPDQDFDSYLEACAVAALQALQKAPSSPFPVVRFKGQGLHGLD